MFCREKIQLNLRCENFFILKLNNFPKCFKFAYMLSLLSLQESKEIIQFERRILSSTNC